MPHVDLVVESDVSRTARARQVEALFDVPPSEKSKVSWSGDVPIDDFDWNVGLIVGPSGCGKSTLAKNIFGEAYHPPMEWGGKSIVDDFRKGLSVADITKACSAVGFNTIPAWLRPFHVLSTGERFRAEIARRVLELPDPVVIDEFTSVVDRQVAKVASHAIQKYVRRGNRKLVAVGCHFDVIDWLQPDWILEPATMSFQRRSVRRRPSLEITIQRVPYAMWKLFAPYHYLTADLAKSAKCFALFVGEQPAAFCGAFRFAHPTVRDIMRNSRTVTLPDYQGLGLAFVLMDTLGAAYKATGNRFRSYPAHPQFTRAFQRSRVWAQTKEAGTFQAGGGAHAKKKGLKQRPCATFEYCGPAMPSAVEAARLLR